jgi:hypothetical protein
VLAAHGCDVAANWTAQQLRRREWTAVIAAGLDALLLASVAPSLDNLYHNPSYARDDYRGIQRLIATDRRLDDAVLFLAPNQWKCSPTISATTAICIHLRIGQPPTKRLTSRCAQ